MSHFTTIKTQIKDLEALRAACDELKVVYTSGYSSDIMGGEPAVRGDFKFLQKPYAPPLLAKTVRECLDF